MQHALRSVSFVIDDQTLYIYYLYSPLWDATDVFAFEVLLFISFYRIKIYVSKTPDICLRFLIYDIDTNSSIITDIYIYYIYDMVLTTLTSGFVNKVFHFKV